MPIIASFDSATREYAPITCFSASISRSTTVEYRLIAINWMNTSELVVDWNRQPRRTRVAAQHMRVGEVAIVRHREAAELEIGIERLHVPENCLAGGGIAIVPDRDAARQPVDHLLVAEILAHRPQAAVRMKFRHRRR